MVTEANFKFVSQLRETIQHFAPWWLLNLCVDYSAANEQEASQLDILYYQHYKAQLKVLQQHVLQSRVPYFWTNSAYCCQRDFERYMVLGQNFSFSFFFLRVPNKFK